MYNNNQDAHTNKLFFDEGIKWSRNFLYSKGSCGYFNSYYYFINSGADFNQWLIAFKNGSNRGKIAEPDFESVLQTTKAAAPQARKDNSQGNPDISMHNSHLGPLPSGWEIKIDPKGRLVIYFLLYELNLI